MGLDDTSERYRIAVAVGNPDHAEQLARTAVDVARDRDGEVFIVGVLVKPQESPFALFTDEVITRQFGDERRAVLDRAMEVTTRTDVPVSGRLFVADSVARGVLHAVEETDSDALLVGWQERRGRRLDSTSRERRNRDREPAGEQRRTSERQTSGQRRASEQRTASEQRQAGKQEPAAEQEPATEQELAAEQQAVGDQRQAGERSRESAVLGTNVDRILRRADCDVLVEKIGAVAEEVEAVLLPVADSPHAELAASVARAIAASNDARVTLLRVVGSKHEESAARDLLAGTTGLLAGVESETTIQEGGVADVIVAESKRHDVTVLGATRTGMVRRQIVGSVPQAVGRRAEGTVIMARKGDGSLMSRVFRL